MDISAATGTSIKGKKIISGISVFQRAYDYEGNQLALSSFSCNKAGYTATPVACRWAGAVLEEVTRARAGAVGSKSSKTPKK